MLFLDLDGPPAPLAPLKNSASELAFFDRQVTVDSGLALRLTLRLLGPCREHLGLIVRRHFRRSDVDHRAVAIRLAHRCLEVVWHQPHRDAAHKFLYRRYEPIQSDNDGLPMASAGGG